MSNFAFDLPLTTYCPTNVNDCASCTGWLASVEQESRRNSFWSFNFILCAAEGQRIRNVSLYKQELNWPEICKITMMLPDDCHKHQKGWPILWHGYFPVTQPLWKNNNKNHNVVLTWMYNFSYAPPPCYDLEVSVWLMGSVNSGEWGDDLPPHPSPSDGHGKPVADSSGVGGRR